VCSSSSSLGQHSRIWVESCDVLEEVGEEQSDSARPATGVEEATATIEVEVLGESVGQSWGVRFSTLPVVGGGTFEHGLVPDPVLPRVACLPLRHVFSVAELQGADCPHTPGQWGSSAQSGRPAWHGKSVSGRRVST
jgi:hypothetical protein